jgi:hypothetical protein
MAICREVAPHMLNINGTHRVSCHLYDDAPPAPPS